MNNQSFTLQVSGEFRPDMRAFAPHGVRPINPTMMMHIPPSHTGPTNHMPPGMVRPPDWQPDSHVIIKEEPPSPDEDKSESFQIDDLEPGEIRPAGSNMKSTKVMSVGPNNNRFPQDAGYDTMPMLQPAPSAGGMRLPVAAANTGHHGNFTPYRQQQDDNVLDLTKKCDEAVDRGDDRDSCRSTPTIPSGTSTPKHGKKKSKFFLDSMVARLWQNKMSHSDGPGDQSQNEQHTKSEAAPHRESREQQQKHQQQQPESHSVPETSVRVKREAAPSRDARRKGRPMKGDTSVNSDTGAGLQFTFINDSESGKMNLVGVSKPNPNVRDGSRLTAGSQWTQIGKYLAGFPFH